MRTWAGPLAILLTASGAFAERRALTADIGVGETAIAIAAPSSQPRTSEWGGAPEISVGARYSLANQIDVVASGFFEPPVNYYHANTTAVTADGSFPGVTTHRLERFGAVAGAHYVFGHAVRFRCGLELGWSHRSYWAIDQVDVSDPQFPRTYGLRLKAFTADNLVVSPVAGVEWAFADHASVALMPRVQLLLLRESTIALSLTASFSYSFYL